MNRIVFSLFMFVMFSLTLSIPALAQQQISGTQTGTLGPGSYLVTGSINVPVNQTLTILPGTEFLHNGYHTWTINGKLIAQGTEIDSIRFVRQNPILSHRWGGIRFQSSASLSTFEYCVIDNCQSSGIYTIYANLTISNSRISNCTAVAHGAGISKIVARTKPLGVIKG